MIEKRAKILDSSSCVQQICTPLSDLEISLFHFVRVFNDNARFSLSNNPLLNEFIYDFYINKYSVVDVNYMERINSESSQIIDFKKKYNTVAKYTQDASNQFYDAYLFINTLPNYIDYVYFSGANKENTELYIKYTDFFKRFYYYFLDAGRSLIIRAQNKLVTPKLTPPIGNKKKESINEFISCTPINRFYINNEMYLTKRECECLSWIGAGKNYEEIALILRIAKRTVINHIEKIKFKTHTNNINELIKYSIENHFHKLF